MRVVGRPEAVVALRRRRRRDPVAVEDAVADLERAAVRLSTGCAPDRRTPRRRRRRWWCRRRAAPRPDRLGAIAARSRAAPRSERRRATEQSARSPHRSQVVDDAERARRPGRACPCSGSERVDGGLHRAVCACELRAPAPRDRTAAGSPRSRRARRRAAARSCASSAGFFASTRSEIDGPVQRRR